MTDNNKIKFLNCNNQIPLPSAKSTPKIRAWHFAVLMLCSREAFFKLVLIKGVIIPSLLSPSQIPTYSGRFSKNNATVSPFRYPWVLNIDATLLLKSSTLNKT